MVDWRPQSFCNKGTIFGGDLATILGMIFVQHVSTVGTVCYLLFVFVGDFLRIVFLGMICLVNHN